MPPTTNSDSEDDDFDYVPPADDHDSDSGPDDEGNVVHAADTAQPPTDPTEQKKQRDALWAGFQASVSASLARANVNVSVNSTTAMAPSSSAVKRVKIEKTYLFAGKHVTEVIEVAEDSEEAKKWPRWSPHPEKTEGRGEDKDRIDNEPVVPPAAAANSSSPTTSTPKITAAAAPITMTAPPTSEVKRPGPRKPRTALPSVPKVPQVKKITTLDKCAVDWRTHVASQSSDVQDQLDVNRRGGGYLEKMDFLKRVEDRREVAFEASKSSKRRKT